MNALFKYLSFVIKRHSGRIRLGVLCFKEGMNKLFSTSMSPGLQNRPIGCTQKTILEIFVVFKEVNSSGSSRIFGKIFR